MIKKICKYLDMLKINNDAEQPFLSIKLLSFEIIVILAALILDLSGKNN